jgi:hypothetical protein
MPDKNVERLASLFEGFAGAHGTHGTPTREPGGLKWAIKTTAKTLREPVTIKLWEQHVAGKRPLGVIPIREDNSCSWGSIDFDEYDEDLLKIIVRAEAAKMPLVPCRSKSGGLHLFLFLTEPTAAGRVQAVLRDMAASLGLSGSEIFPKQAKILAERSDLGNWMVMPYYGGDFDGKLKAQHGLKKTGAEMLLSEFVKLAESRRVGIETLEELTEKRRASGNGAAAPRGKKSRGGAKGDFSDGPPCLQHLAASGVQSDGRKRTLFMQALYFKRGFPDNWKEKIEQSNQKFTPPLPSSEVNSIINSLSKKDYEYTCKEEPMRSHCNSSLCRMRKFGVGQAGDFPVISSLRKLRAQPPVWFLEIEGETLELSTDDLQNYMRFHKIAMDRVNQCYRMMRNDAWLSLVSEAMANLIELDAPADIGEDAEFQEHLEEFLTNRARGTRREDLYLDRPWEDVEEGKHYFTLRALKKFLASEGIKDVSRNKLSSLVKKLGGEPKFINPHGKGLNTWRIPSSKVTAIGELPPPKMEGDKI